jgi:FkbM family methyltransferase
MRPLDRARQWLNRHGLHVARYNPDASLDVFLTALLAHLQIETVLDVGAHVGEFGSRLRRLGYAGQIISFEPVAASYASLAHQAARDERWVTHQVALGRSDGHQPITVPAASVLASFRPFVATLPSALQGVGDLRLETVQVARLDSFPVAGRTLLKLDTQGWDLEVLEGATGILSAVLAVQTELSVLPLYEGAPTMLEALPRLRELGFVPSAMFPVLRDEHLRLREFDCVLVREHAHLPHTLSDATTQASTPS